MKTCSKECAKINFSNNAKAHGLGKESHFKAGSETALRKSADLKLQYKNGQMGYMKEVWKKAEKRWAGKGNPRFKNGLAHGYKLVKVNGRWEIEHRVIMEKKLNRKLVKGEVVHHINGIKLDNRIENLIVMTIGQHLTHHKAERRAKGLKY